jgi:hypothetical protein
MPGPLSPLSRRGWGSSLWIKVFAGTGAGVLVCCGQEGEEGADTVTVLGRVPEQAVGVNRVAGAPAGASAGDVTGGFQVGAHAIWLQMIRAGEAGDATHRSPRTQKGYAADLEQPASYESM